MLDKDWWWLVQNVSDPILKEEVWSIMLVTHPISHPIYVTPTGVTGGEEIQIHKVGAKDSMWCQFFQSSKRYGVILEASILCQLLWPPKSYQRVSRWCPGLEGARYVYKNLFYFGTAGVRILYFFSGRWRQLPGWPNQGLEWIATTVKFACGYFTIL